MASGDENNEKCCCGWSFQTGTRIVAMVGLFLALLSIVLTIVLILLLGWIANALSGVMVIVGLILDVCGVFLNILLFIKARKADVSFCRHWVRWNKFLIIVSSVFVALSGVNGTVAGIPINVLAVAKYLLFNWVVNKFVADVKANPSRYTMDNCQTV